MDLLTLPEVIATLVGLFLVYHMWRWRINMNNHVGKGIDQAPEPKGAWPIIGHLHLLGGRALICRVLAAMANELGPVFTIRLGMHRALVVSSRETVMECFTTNDRAFLSRPKTVALKYMGYGGAMSALGPHGPLWNKFRKVTTLELLSNSRLELLKHVRASEVDLCIKDLYSMCMKQPCSVPKRLDNHYANGVDDSTASTTKVDMAHWFRLVTMNMMLRVIVGRRYCLLDDENYGEARRFATTLDEFMYLTGVFEFSNVIPHIEWMDLQGHLRSMKRNAKEMDYFMSKWLEEHIQSRKNDKMKEEGDFVDVLLTLFPEDGVEFGHKNENIIKATSLSLIMGGSDTMMASMTWALSLLLNHRNYLKIVQEEVDLHVGRERWVEESDIKNLAYLQAIVKETLRLYPPGPLMIPREAIEDCYVAGYYVPKGTHLIVNAWKLHRDPRVWDDPCEFRPERFLVRQARLDAREQQFEYLPFSFGRRSCPGMTAAYQMMHLVLARVLQGFAFETPMNAPVDMTEGLGLTLPKAMPLEVLLAPRLEYKLYM